MLQDAVKLQKTRGDNYLSVDTLLLAVLDNKDVAEALNESGALLVPSALCTSTTRKYKHLPAPGVSIRNTKARAG